MAKEIQAPNKLDDAGYSIFLAGSIEMGEAEKWQERVVRLLKNNENVIIFNPRRDDWDSSWVESKDNAQFREQVEWELKAMEYADKIIMYFDPDSKAPISLLEFGLFARSKRLIVICPKGFWKKGNVDVVCEKYRVKQVESLKEAVDIIERESIVDPVQKRE